MAGAGGRSTRGAASGRRGPWEEDRSREVGKAKSEGWSGWSYDPSDAETEKEGWGNNTLKALLWGMQESGSGERRQSVIW